MKPAAATHSLSARLLAFTILFIMVVELLVFPTSIAKFKLEYMRQRVEYGYLSYLAINAAFEPERQAIAAEQLLGQMDVYQIQTFADRTLTAKIRRYDAPLPAAAYDLRTDNVLNHMASAMDTLFSNENRILRVVGRPERDPGLALAIDFEEAPLKRAMLAHLEDVFAVSILISVITAMLIFITIQVLMVNPIRDLTKAMVAFRKGPENPENVIVPTPRHDELGIAERELSQMQEEIRAALRQKERLANIGTAVTKINHDLRGILATAQLVSDRLSGVNDPQVQEAAPAIMNSINKAVELCSQTLKYAREGIPTLKKTQFWLLEPVQQLASQMKTMSQGRFLVEAGIPPDLTVLADKAQLLRVFSNLGKNAFEAGATKLTITVTRQNNMISVWVSDNGPGLPAHMLEKLFQPFGGTTRKGGSGLGLAIAREILVAHGGDMILAENSSEGATFKLDLPAPQMALSLESLQ